MPSGNQPQPLGQGGQLGSLARSLELSTPALVLHPPKRSLTFLLTVGLLGAGLAFTLSMLDPFLYTEKARLLAPPGLKNTTLSFITIITLLVAFIVQPVVGQWSDRTRSRWGRRAPYLSGGIIGLSLALILMVATDNLWLLIVAVMLISTFSNTVQGPWQALIPDHVPEPQHGLAAGIKTLVELVGVVAAVGLVSLTVAQGNLWAAPLTSIGLLLVILPVTLYTLHKAPQITRLISSNRLEKPATLLKLNFSHLPAAFPWWMLNRFLFWAAAIAIRTFILNYMEDVLSLSLAQAQALSNQLFLWLGGAVFLLVLPAGMLADRIGRRPLLMMAGLMAATGATFFIFLRDLNLLFVAGGLIGGGAGIFASASWALVTDIAPKTEGALYLGLANVATVLGSISGRLGGPLIDGLNQLTSTTTLGYLVVFGVAALFFVGSSVVVLKIHSASHLKPKT